MLKKRINQAKEFEDITTTVNNTKAGDSTRADFYWDMTHRSIYKPIAASLEPAVKSLTSTRALERSLPGREVSRGAEWRRFSSAAVYCT